MRPSAAAAAAWGRPQRSIIRAATAPTGSGCRERGERHGPSAQHPEAQPLASPTAWPPSPSHPSAVHPPAQSTLSLPWGRRPLPFLLLQDAPPRPHPMALPLPGARGQFGVSSSQGSTAGGCAWPCKPALPLVAGPPGAESAPLGRCPWADPHHTPSCPGLRKHEVLAARGAGSIRAGDASSHTGRGPRMLISTDLRVALLGSVHSPPALPTSHAPGPGPEADGMLPLPSRT